MSDRFDQSRRLAAVQSPIIPVVGELIRENPATISLGQGVVHYPPPPEVAEAVAEFLPRPENHKYQLVQGIAPLLEAVAAKLAADNRIAIDRRSRIVVTAGANMGFLNAVLAVADPGDEIVLLSPYYFNHEMAVTIASCRAVVVPTDADHQPDPARIEAALTERTRAVVTISPNNPTGAVYGEAVLREINALCGRRGICHIHDEAYEYFVYDGAEHFSPGSIDDAPAHTISLFSLSKSFGLASWRIGYMVLPAGLFEAVRKIQDTNLICPPAVSQHAALACLEAGSSYPRGHLTELDRVRRGVLRRLSDLSETVEVAPAQGAFYVLIRLRRADLDDMQVVSRLVREHKVAVIPGSTFGAGGGCHLRIAYGALREDTISEGMDRLVAGLSSLPGV